MRLSAALNAIALVAVGAALIQTTTVQGAFIKNLFGGKKASPPPKQTGTAGPTPPSNQSPPPLPSRIVTADTGGGGGGGLQPPTHYTALPNFGHPPVSPSEAHESPYQPMPPPRRPNAPPGQPSRANLPPPTQYQAMPPQPTQYAPLPNLAPFPPPTAQSRQQSPTQYQAMPPLPARQPAADPRSPSPQDREHSHYVPMPSPSRRGGGGAQAQPPPVTEQVHSGQPPTSASPSGRRRTPPRGPPPSHAPPEPHTQVLSPSRPNPSPSGGPGGLPGRNSPPRVPQTSATSTASRQGAPRAGYGKPIPPVPGRSGATSGTTQQPPLNQSPPRITGARQWPPQQTERQSPVQAPPTPGREQGTGGPGREEFAKRRGLVAGLNFGQQNVGAPPRPGGGVGNAPPVSVSQGEAVPTRRKLDGNRLGALEAALKKGGEEAVSPSTEASAPQAVNAPIPPPAMGGMGAPPPPPPPPSPSMSAGQGAPPPPPPPPPNVAARGPARRHAAVVPATGADTVRAGGAGAGRSPPAQPNQGQGRMGPLFNQNELQNLRAGLRKTSSDDGKRV